mmetsp:Transcript_14388/g.38228  ORF Transcript_14388/g.38228 Transcript_14388/m.38228 type:complete len:105 (+) Transcript_14388:107-421(+)
MGAQRNVNNEIDVYNLVGLRRPMRLRRGLSEGACTVIELKLLGLVTVWSLRGRRRSTTGCCGGVWKLPGLPDALPPSRLGTSGLPWQEGAGSTQLPKRRKEDRA